MAGKTRGGLKNSKIICGQCKLQIEEEEQFIQCDKCHKKFHVICTQLVKPKYNYLLKHAREKYVCHLCGVNNNNNNITKDLNEVKTELKKLDQGVNSGSLKR